MIGIKLEPFKFFTSLLADIKSCWVFAYISKTFLFLSYWLKEGSSKIFLIFNTSAPAASFTSFDV